MEISGQVEASLSFDVECKSCGNSLEGSVSQSYYGIAVTIEPCENCLQGQYNEGYAAGVSSDD